MSKVRVKLNQAGVRELLKSGEIMGVCKDLANGVAARAGTGYEVNTHVGKNRVNAEVRAETYEAYRDNMKNNTLLKVLR